jgi:hypothetical protein
MRSRYLFRAVPVLALLSVFLWSGMPSFGAEVPEKLGERLPGLADLTPDQQAEVQEILTEHLARLPALAGRPDTLQEIRKLQSETLERLGTILTPEQLAQLRASMPAFFQRDRLPGARAASGAAMVQAATSPAACSDAYDSISAGKLYTEFACSDGACDYAGHADHNNYSVNDYLTNCQARDSAANAESLAQLALNDCTYADDAANAAASAASIAGSGAAWADLSQRRCSSLGHFNTCAANAFSEASYASGLLNQGSQQETACFACCFILAAPTNLFASATSATSIKLTWKDTNSKETNTKIERNTNATGWIEVYSVGADVTSKVDSGAASTDGHRYRVRAFNSNCSIYSPYSAQALVPKAPTDLTGTRGTGAKFILNWRDRSGAINEEHFEIQRKVGTGSWATLATVAADVTTYTATLVTGVNRFRVRALTSTGESWFTNEVSYTY